MDVAKRDPAQAAQLLEDRIHIEAARKNIQFLASRFTIIQSNTLRFLSISISFYHYSYARSQPSPSPTEETAEETTETDSQAPLPDPRQMLQIDPYQQPM